MLALVITCLPPLTKSLEVRGTYRRFCLFMDAISVIADKVVILHLTSGGGGATVEEMEHLNDEQRTFFGLPVSTYLVEPRTRRTTFLNHYISGIGSIYEQDDFFAFSGSAHATIVADLLD